MHHTAQPWDFIVIGAGIVGSAAAYFAARRGLKVLIIDRDTPGAAQSGRNLGFVRQQNRDFRELDLAIAARHLWTGLEAELGRSVGWFQGGNLALAFTEQDLARFADWRDKARGYDLDTRLLSVSEVMALLPTLSANAGFKGALYTASDGRAEPARATRAFFEAALEHGATPLLGEAVTAIDTAGGQVTGAWVGGRLFRASRLLCAAGAGSGRLLRNLGVRLPQERIRATVVMSNPYPDFQLHPCVSGETIGLRQSVSGALIFSVAGGEYDVRPDSWRWFRAYAQTRKDNPGAARVNYMNLLRPAHLRSYPAPLADVPPSREGAPPEPRRVQEATSELLRYFPALAGLGIRTSWAGIIDTLPDVIPAIGTVRKAGGLLVATGFSGHGFCPGPMAGKIMADMAAGVAPPLDLAALSPDRFNGRSRNESRQA